MRSHDSGLKTTSGIRGVGPARKVRRLGEWVEEYDGDVTIIDLDLSALAGEAIRPILGVEALTKNVADAQGFWFVPIIANQD